MASRFVARSAVAASRGLRPLVPAGPRNVSATATRAISSSQVHLASRDVEHPARNTPTPLTASEMKRDIQQSPTSSRATTNTTAAMDPKEKAASLLDALPGNSMLSKAAILSTSAALSIYAISNEYYVVNEETVIAFCLLSMWIGAIQYGGPLYNKWADEQTAKIRDVLDAARSKHREAVQKRIDNVTEMGQVVDVTRNLFAVSRETAELEAKAFELEQRTTMAAEAKAVLDSWVRYESQVKQRQQKELSSAVIANVTKELENPKNLQQILQQSIADAERILTTPTTQSR